METDHSSKKLGGNVDAWCGKCKMVLAHTIEAMVGEKPTRVGCNTCKSHHAYKAQAPRTTGVTRTAKPKANRYQSLLNGPAKQIVEFEETERFRTWERWSIEFEQAMIAHELAV